MLWQGFYLNDKIAHGQHCHKGIEHAYGEQHVKML